MVVADSQLESGGAARRLDPSYQTGLAEGAQSVVHGLFGYTAEAELDGRCEGIYAGVRVCFHLVEQREAGRRHAQAGAAEQADHPALTLDAWQRPTKALRFGFRSLIGLHVQTLVH
jgi:hypothetical protein